MGLLFGAPRERRDAFPYPVIPPNSEAGSVSLRRVSLSKADAAMQKVAIFAAVNLIASVGEMLPFNVFRGLGTAKVQLPTPSWLADLGGKGYGTGDFIWQMLYCWGLRGNVVGIPVERSPQTAQPTTIDLAHPDDVQVRPDPDDANAVKWSIRGKDAPNVWHQRCYPTPGRVTGLSPIALHAVTIGQGLYAQNFGAQWFLDGAHPSAILQNNSVDSIDDPTARTVKQRFLTAIRGTREPVVLGKGWEYKQIQIAPAESQFLETQEYTAAECARIYGPGMPEILGYKVGNSMTYANIEQRSIDLLKYTLDPWLTRAERVLSSLLPQPQYVRFDRRALLQTDTLTRFQAHSLALKNAFMVVNDVRDVEDMEPVKWGDEPYLPALGPAAAAAALNDDTLGPDQPDQPAPAKPALTVIPKGGKPA